MTSITKLLSRTNYSQKLQIYNKYINTHHIHILSIICQANKTETCTDPLWKNFVGNFLLLFPKINKIEQFHNM